MDRARGVRVACAFSLVFPLALPLTTAGAVAQEGIEDWNDLANVSDDLNGDYVLANDLNESTPGYDSVANEAANGGNGFDPIG